MNKLFSVSYRIPPDIFRAGITFYHKKYIRIKDMIFVAVFALMTLEFIRSVYQDRDNSVGYFLIALCISMIVMKLIYSRRRKNMLIEAAQEFNDETTLEVYEDKITIKAEDSDFSSNIPFSEKKVKAYRQGNFFMVIGDCYYIIPAESLGENTAAFTQLLEKKLGNKFILCTE